MITLQLLLVVISFVTFYFTITVEGAEPTHILPLILIKTKDGEITYPKEIFSSVTFNAEIIYGTKFISNTKGEQIFACGPKPDDIIQDKYTSYIPTYKEYDVLTCDNEPTPFVNKSMLKVPNSEDEWDIPCGPKDSNGKKYAFGYKVKVYPEPIISDVYSFCYDEVKHEVIYTEHTIRSPALLSDQRLSFEQKTKYDMSTDGYEYFNTQFKNIEQAYAKMETQNEAQRQLVGDSDKPKPLAESPLYAQKLVSPDDLALALWRKPTYHFLNTKAMREAQVQLWDYVTKLILKEAKNKSVEFNVYTGAFKITKSGRSSQTDLIQVPDVWIKIVEHKWGPGDEHSESLAVVMNHNTQNPDVAKTFDSICPKDLCEEAFVTKFTQVRKTLRCCESKSSILEYFGIYLDVNINLKIDTFFENSE